MEDKIGNIRRSSAFGKDFARIMKSVLMIYAEQKGYTYRTDLDLIDISLTLPEKDWETDTYARPIFDTIKIRKPIDLDLSFVLLPSGLTERNSFTLFAKECAEYYYKDNPEENNNEEQNKVEHRQTIVYLQVSSNLKEADRRFVQRELVGNVEFVELEDFAKRLAQVWFSDVDQNSAELFFS